MLQLLGFQQHCGIDLSGQHLQKASTKNISTKTKLQKRGGKVEEKRLRTVISTLHSVKNTSQSHSLNAAHDQKTSLAQQQSVHQDSFSYFRFYIKMTHEQNCLDLCSVQYRKHRKKSKIEA